MSIKRGVAKSIARTYYNPGTVKNALVVQLLTSAYPQDKFALASKVGTDYVQNRIAEIENETPIRIDRTKVTVGSYATTPTTLYSFGSFQS